MLNRFYFVVKYVLCSMVRRMYGLVFSGLALMQTIRIYDKDGLINIEGNWVIIELFRSLIKLILNVGKTDSIFARWNTNHLLLL